ncbi:cytochrome P450 [Aspergillus caelatus]|uniref:Cytochrome P450 n=1 Tax=Aspergillus caelatus TaxID=61420 RepID=A0A5N6ZQ11_9EURO|nr:cytochrome P450 [Aspergillus caelatus]KAE8359468.1 cytochrome P450 [Aspergillus caelatus]
MAFIQSIVSETPSAAGSAFLAALVVGYVVYQRYLHPLARYPGPFLASIKDLGQVHQFLSLQQPYHLTTIHERYGPIVRYGPDKLSITHESAIPIIYQKGAKSMPKTEFYDAYWAAHPNVFGMRDEVMYSTRLRRMSHKFSLSYVKEMGEYLDLNLRIPTDKTRFQIERGEVFDLKKALHYYVSDVLGELAFSQSFGVQEADDDSLIPLVIEHSFLAAVTGVWPAVTMTLKRWLPLRTARRLSAALWYSKGLRRSPVEMRERLKPIDLETEAFGFITPGTHTTSATFTLLFYHLLHNPEFMRNCVEEIDSNLPSLGPTETAYSIVAAEASLPFLRNCIRDNFRITLVFTMPLARRIGMTVANTNIYKLLGTLLKEFTFELADERDRVGVEKGMYKGRIPKLFSAGISDPQDLCSLELKFFDGFKEALRKTIIGLLL